MFSSYAPSEASTSAQSSSIADMLREAAQEVLTANIPPGFYFVPEYGVYYSHECGYYYDEKTNLFYHLESKTYYYYDQEAGQYKVYKSLHPLEWKKRAHRRMAIEMLGDKAVEDMDQVDVDACETLFLALDDLPETPEEREDNRKYHEGERRKRDRERRRRREDEYYERMERESGRKREIFDGDELIEVEDRRYRDERRWDEGGSRSRERRNWKEDDDRRGGRWQDTRRYHSSESEGEYNRRRYEDERITMMREEGYDQAPCVRLIHRETLDLFIVTVNGGILGNSLDCDVKVPDSTLPPRIAQIIFVEDPKEEEEGKNGEKEKREEEEGERRDRSSSRSSSSERSGHEKRERRRDRSDEEEKRRKERSRARRRERRSEERRQEKRKERRRRKKGIIDFVDRRQGKYYLKVLSNGAKCLMDGHKIKKESPEVWIQHGSVLSFAKSNSFSVHIHSGRNTCADCEPGLLRATAMNEGGERVEKPRLKGERARREEMKRMKEALGLKGEDTEEERREKYFDRAKIRRKTVGSDMPDLPKRPRPSGPGMYDGCDAKPLPGAVPIVTATDAKVAAKKAIGEENKGFKLLKAMGWTEGEGLGKTIKGRVEPVANEVKTNRAGLGASGGSSVPIAPPNAVWEIARNRFKEIEKAEKKN